jgi:iron complex transport system substrate-binding protein
MLHTNGSQALLQVLSGRWTSLRIALVCICASLSACAGPQPPQQSDASAAAAQKDLARIVSLDATATEWLFALDMGDRVVGRDAKSSFPAATASIPNLGHHSQWNAEAILALNPDRVLVHRNQSDVPVLEQLRAVGVEVSVLDRASSPEGAVSFARQLGVAIHQEARIAPSAKALEEALRARGLLAGTSDGAASQGAVPDGAVSQGAISDGATSKRSVTEGAADPSSPSVLFVYASSAGRVMVGGAHTPMDAMLRLSGGRNAAASVRGYKPVSPEFLMASQPDLVLLFPHSLEALGGMDGLARDPGLGALDAVRNGNVAVLDGLLLTGFGPRLPEAYDALTAVLNRTDA